MVARTTSGEEDSERLTKQTRGLAKGFPHREKSSGVIGKSGTKWLEEGALTFYLPPSTAANDPAAVLYEPETLNVSAKLYTTELSKITDALETLIREPCGCFEQTSSTTYPLVMALLLMKAMPTRDAVL